MMREQVQSHAAPTRRRKRGQLKQRTEEMRRHAADLKILFEVVEEQTHVHILFGNALGKS
jgi:hypothetical protein